MADQIMAESKPPKPGLLRRILWGLWVALLTALLVLGLVFAAPWKVITLIAIFLAAATILPRIYRKWFWLSVGIVVLATIAWIFLPDDNKDWRPYQFDKELAQLQARYAVPDSENAAIIYNQILADWKQKEANEPNLPDCWFDLAKYGPWSSKDQPEIAAYIQYHKDTIEAVLRATRIEKCSFPIVANLVDYNKDMDRFPAMRKWAYLLVAAGNNDRAEEHTSDAVEKYLAVLRMGQHSSRQPSVLNMLVGIAIEALGLGGINTFVVLGNTNEPCLSKLEQVISAIKHDWNSDLPGFIEPEKLMLKNTWGGLFYEVNSKGNVRLSHDPWASMRKQAKEWLANEKEYDANTRATMQQWISPGYWWKRYARIQTILFWFYAPATPEKLSGTFDTNFEKHYTMIKPDFDWSKEPQDVPMESLVKCGLNFRQAAKLMALSNNKLYFGLHYIYLKSLAEQRGALLIIAMRRYKNANGYWPESLDDVKTLVSAETFVDPMNNGSFVYKRTDDGFILYGKGKNGIDEDGKYEYNWPTKPGADDLLIWPFKSKVSRQQEQKADE